MRRIGQIVMGAALAAAIIGGLYLATRVNEIGAFAPVFPLAGALFLGVTLAAAAGVYLYLRGEPAEDIGLTDTELQRRLADAMAGGDQISFDALSRVLGIGQGAVAKLLRDMAGFGVLSAAVNWDTGVIYPRNRGYLLVRQECLHCVQPLTSTETPAVCEVCRTAHFDV